MYVVCSHRIYSIISEASVILGASAARGTTLTTSSSYSKNEQSLIVRFRGNINCAVYLNSKLVQVIDGPKMKDRLRSKYVPSP